MTPQSSNSSVDQKQTLLNVVPLNTSPENLDTALGIIKQSAHKAHLTPVHHKRNINIEPSVFENHSGDMNEWFSRVVSTVRQKLADLAHQHQKQLTEQHNRNREIVENLRATIMRISNVKYELNEMIRKDHTEIMSVIKMRMNKMDKSFDSCYEKFMKERTILQ